MELTNYWSPKNMQSVLALVDIRVESMLRHGHPDHFREPMTCKEQYGGHYSMVHKSKVTLGSDACFPCLYDVYVYLVAEYILEWKH